MNVIVVWIAWAIVDNRELCFVTIGPNGGCIGSHVVIGLFDQFVVVFVDVL